MPKFFIWYLFGICFGSDDGQKLRQTSLRITSLWCIIGFITEITILGYAFNTRLFSRCLLTAFVSPASIWLSQTILTECLGCGWQSISRAWMWSSWSDKHHFFSEILISHYSGCLLYLCWLSALSMLFCCCFVQGLNTIEVESIQCKFQNIVGLFGSSGFWNN